MGYEEPYVINIMQGDVNLDGKVDVADVSELISIVSGKWDSSKSYGTTGTIEVTFDPTKQFVGGFRKSISVYLNSSKSNYTRLFIKGEMVDKE